MTLNVKVGKHCVMVIIISVLGIRMERINYRMSVLSLAISHLTEPRIDECLEYIGGKKKGAQVPVVTIK